MNGRQKFTKEEMETFVRESISLSDVCRKCGWKPTGGNNRIVKRYIKEYGLSTEHFNPYAKSTARLIESRKEVPVEKYLVQGSYIKTDRLKKKLIEAGYKENRCEVCGITEWNGKSITLQIHHINGDHTDNRLENLQLLCPNCHSQTDNYCQKKPKRYCPVCGAEIKSRNSTLCPDCYRKVLSEKQRKVDMPTKEGLYKLIQKKSFVEVGRMFGVSDNAVRRWCRKYDLPSTKQELKKLNQPSDSEEKQYLCTNSKDYIYGNELRHQDSVEETGDKGDPVQAD